MRAADAIRYVYETFPVGMVMDAVEDLAGLDRFQASRGIEQAADLVAGLAERAGLSGVEVKMFQADGHASWWSFASPRSWTPLAATLDLLAPSPARVADFSREPFVLATHSAPTRPAGETFPLLDILDPGAWERAPGTVAVVPSQAVGAPGLPAFRLVVEELERRGAAGLVTDAASRHLGDDTAARGRVELDRHTKIFGFSVAPRVLGMAREAVGPGAQIRACVRVDRSARMPIVHGVLPAAAPGGPEILLQAHLCHPRPSANDNASGVAALLGIATALARSPDVGRAIRAVRFLWCPEFTGTAAYLHDVVAAGRHQAPSMILNLDMAGEDPHQCGGPLVIEDPPIHIPTFLPALAEEFLHLLPSAAASYSGAVALPESPWISVPFCGASDHVLYADRSVARPAISIGHWPDRYRHSSLDTPDRVSPAELRRISAVVGGLASYLRWAELESVPFIQAAVMRWSADRIGRISRRAASRERYAGTTVFDPFGPGNVTGFLSHQVGQARMMMSSAGGMGDGHRPEHSALTAGLAEQASMHAWLVDGAGSSGTRGELVLAAGGPVYRRVWRGPFNLEGVIAEASEADRIWLIEQDAGSDSAYPLMMALALAIGDETSFSRIVRAAAYSTWLPVNIPFAERYLGVLLATGWITAEPGRPRTRDDPG